MAVILKLSLLRIVFSVERNVIISCRVELSTRVWRIDCRVPCAVATAQRTSLVRSRIVD